MSSEDHMKKQGDQSRQPELAACEKHGKMLKLLKEGNTLEEEVYDYLFESCAKHDLNDTLMDCMLNSKKVDVNKRNSSGETILHVLTRRNHYLFIEKLVSNKSNIKLDAKCRQRKTPLLIAAEYGHLELFKFLRSKGASIYWTDGMENSALHFAAMGGHIECLQYLIEHEKMDVNMKNEYKDTPLIHAAGNGHYSCVQYLLDNNADVYHVEKNGKDVLYYAIFGKSLECVKLILDVISSDNIRERHYIFAVYLGYIDVLNYLIEIDKKFPNRFDNCILINAARRKHESIVKVLLKAGMHVDAKNSNGITALHLATDLGYENIVKILLEAGANVNILKKNGSTALIVAATKGYEDIVESLIIAGADVNKQDSKGDTALSCAVSRGHYSAAIHLLNACADVNIKNGKGLSPLHLATIKPHPQIVQALIDPKFNGNLNIIDELGETPLIIASRRGEFEIVDILKKAGANTMLRNRRGRTAYDVAKNSKIAKLLQ